MKKEGMEEKRRKKREIENDSERVQERMSGKGHRD